MNISLVEPCPPHQWAHAPTVGYFVCGKCRERVEYSDPRYDQMLKEQAALNTPSQEGERR